MKTDLVRTMAGDFESHVHQIDGMDIWFAREMQTLLGYTEWRNFKGVIEKAKIACKTAGGVIEDHFVDANKKVELGSGAEKEMEDVMLTRYACYLIAQNGNPIKPQIAFAMNYFAFQTRKVELLEKRINDWERIQARSKLKETESKFGGVIFERGVDGAGLAYIRSKGDKALFGGHTTDEMKDKLNVPDKRPLADFLPTITIKAKDFAAEITMLNMKKDDAITNSNMIANEHEKNNKNVRNLLTQEGIFPENLPKEDDIKKVEREVNATGKKIIDEMKPAKKIQKKDKDTETK